jgi:hypothetical protein
MKITRYRALGGLWVVGEGHSSNRNTDNLQECPSKALAPLSDFFLPYHTPQSPLGGWFRGVSIFS